MAVTSWKWYQRETGPGQMSDIVAHTTPVVEALQQQANRLADRAQSNLDTRAVHRTGDSNVGVAHRGDSLGDGTVSRLDSYVYLYDPTDEGAAASIEFGWSQTRENEDGEEFTYGHDGLRVLEDAVNFAVRTGKV